MKLIVYRHDKSKSILPYFETYNIPNAIEKRYTVQDALSYVHENIDPTLTFFSHSTCNHGICGRCAMKINGKNRLACTFLIQDEEIKLEPLNGNYIKDLL